ncbi:MAG: ACP S-malonyltransferase [Chloroflexota bacterium]
MTAVGTSVPSFSCAAQVLCRKTAGRTCWGRCPRVSVYTHTPVARSGAFEGSGGLAVGKVAFLFPGQGSAAIGMGEALAEASSAARRVLDRLGELAPTVRQLIHEGPREELIRTSNAQPAIFAVDCAALAALAERDIHPDVTAGHSLGEYAALVGAGVLDFDDGLPLVLQRGEVMEQSAAAQPGTMMAILGSNPETVNALIAEWQQRGIIANANDNAPGQIVISGSVETLQAAAPAFRELGARVMDLPVGGAFHSPLMAHGERGFAAALEAAPFRDGRVPVVSNYTAGLSQTADEVRAALRPQITGQVRWRESVDAMLAFGVDTFIEAGPGKVLSGLVQRCTRGQTVTILNVEDPASLEKAVAALHG